jgi:hypothetical protein
MAINLSNLSDVLTSKVASSNSSTSQAELDRQSSLSTKLSNFADAVTYTANTAFPAASVSNAGQIVYDSGADKYYFSTGSDWSSLGYLPPVFQGSNYGYSSGGSPTSNVIDKFAFATDTDATDVGDLTVARFNAAGQSSETYGYTSGGRNPSLPPSYLNIIDKFLFATDANASDVGDLTVERGFIAGQSSTDYGYSSGGFDPSVGASSNVIDKFPFATDANATDVGNLTIARRYLAGQSSTDYGYSSGGLLPGTTNVIDKFPFATDANATDVGDLTVTTDSPSGQSSTDYGYTSGGRNPPSTTYTNVIDKFPFATDANATDVGDLTVGRHQSAGQSSTDYGYASGGYNPSFSNVIDKFPFATDGNATDVGDLTQSRSGPTGQQY